MRIHADPDPKPWIKTEVRGCCACTSRSHDKICVFAFRICIGIDTDPAPGSQVNADPILKQALLKVLHFSVTFSQKFIFSIRNENKITW
jgi:hypothetical protein